MVKAVIYPILAEVVLTEDELDPTRLVSKWWRQTAEPVRVAAFSFAALFVSGAVFVAEPSDFPVVYDPAGLQWYAPASEPTPPKAELHASLQLASAVDPDLLTQPETLHVDRWFARASEPVWVAEPINVGASFVVDPSTLLQRITVEKWFAAASEPVRQTPGSLAALISDGAFVGEPGDFAAVYDPAELQWFRPADRPADSAPSLHVSLQQASTTDTDLLTQPETLYVDRWWQQASEPVRVVSPINVGASFTIDPTVLLVAPPTYDPAGLQWFQQTGEPIRKMPRQLTAFIVEPSEIPEVSEAALLISSLIGALGGTFLRTIGKFIR